MWRSFAVIDRGSSEITRWKKRKNITSKVEDLPYGLISGLAAVTQRSTTQPSIARGYIIVRPPVRSNGRSSILLVMFLGRPEPPFRTGLCFTADVFFFFSPRVLRGPSTDRPETCRMVGIWLNFNPTPKIRGALPLKNLGAKNMQNFGQFCTTSDFDREYLRNG